jgi:hypothetical protein
MRRIINVCFVALAVCAVVYGLVIKYYQPTVVEASFSSSENEIHKSLPYLETEHSREVEISFPQE